MENEKEFKFKLDPKGKNKNQLIDTLKFIIESTSDFSYFEKKKLLKEIPNIRTGNTNEFLSILSRISRNRNQKLIINNYNYINFKDAKGRNFKINCQEIYSFVYNVGHLYHYDKTNNSSKKDEYDVFVDNVLKIIQQNRNSDGDYYNYFTNRSKIWSVSSSEFKKDEQIKKTLIDLYVQSRIHETNEKLDKELPFLSFDILLNKYNEQVQEKAKTSENKAEFIEKYGVEAIIKEGNKIIQNKLINDTLFSCMDSNENGNISFAYNLDLYRATEYMSISEIVSIFKKNIEKFNADTKNLELLREKGDEYGQWAEAIKLNEKKFNEFKINKLPRIINILKYRLIKEGLVSKFIDENMLEAKICTELLSIKGVYKDYTKEDNIDLKSIISQNDYFVKKTQFEKLSPFGVLKIKQKQKQVGIPGYAKLF